MTVLRVDDELKIRGTLVLGKVESIEKDFFTRGLSVSIAGHIGKPGSEVIKVKNFKLNKTILFNGKKYLAGIAPVVWEGDVAISLLFGLLSYIFPRIYVIFRILFGWLLKEEKNEIVFLEIKGDAENLSIVPGEEKANKGYWVFDRKEHDLTNHISSHFGRNSQKYLINRISVS